MKNITIVLLIYFVPFFMKGQENVEVKYQKNQVNFELTDIPTAFFTFSYERKIGKHLSVDLGVGFKSNEGLIKFSGIDTERIKSNDLTYSGFKLIPELRYYISEPSNGAMLSGFYFGTYLKYSGFKSDLEGIYIDSEDVSHNFEYRADISVTSIGFMVGYKLPVTKHFSIDFLIAGPGSGSYSFKLKNVIPPPDEFYDDLNSALDDYSILDLINSDFKFKNNRLKTNFSTVSFRYGISLGYSF